jgi:outer membrane protein OmpA-like peptidoglycan-associated protein
MKRVLVMIGAILSFAFVAPAFAADWSGPELGVEIGGAFGSGTGSAGCDPPTPCAPALHYSVSPNGPFGGVHGGYNFQFNQFVLGAEADIDGGWITGSDRLAGSYIFSERNAWDASVRGRIGAAFDKFLVYGTGGVAFGDFDQKAACAGCVLGGTFETFNTTRVGWTAGAGFDYAIANNWSAGLEYRYTDLGSANFACLACNDTDHNTYNFSSLRFRVTYRFAPPPPAPPMVAMPAAAPAPAPMMARTFLVFFDFDRYNLTPDARRVIDAAAGVYKAGGHPRIDVSGYTDLAGTQAYNLRLSQRRADAVARYLMKQGVPKTAMDVKWFGKEHPRVPTADGVREPQNRRVEIVMP